MQILQCGMRCVARNAVPLKPNVVSIISSNSGQKKWVIRELLIAPAVDGDGLADAVLYEIWTDDAASLNSTPDSEFFGMHWILLGLIWIGIVPNSSILFVHVPIYPEMGLMIIAWASTWAGPSTRNIATHFDNTI